MSVLNKLSPKDKKDSYVFLQGSFQERAGDKRYPCRT